MWEKNKTFINFCLMIEQCEEWVVKKSMNKTKMMRVNKNKIKKSFSVGRCVFCNAKKLKCRSSGCRFSLQFFFIRHMIWFINSNSNAIAQKQKWKRIWNWWSKKKYYLPDSDQRLTSVWVFGQFFVVVISSILL